VHHNLVWCGRIILGFPSDYRSGRLSEYYVKDIVRKEKNAGHSMKNDDQKITNEQVYLLMCWIQQINVKMLCVANGNSRQIGNMVVVCVTCGLFCASYVSIAASGCAETNVILLLGKC
jgi:hypothetical protein